MWCNSYLGQIQHVDTQQCDNLTNNPEGVAEQLRLNAYAQDTLFFHNGSIAEGKVLEVTDVCLKFIYKGEDAVIIIGRNCLQSVKFKSGRIEEMSPKVIINGPEDWNNVRVVYNKDEVRGMKFIRQIEKHSRWNMVLLYIGWSLQKRL